MRKKISKITAKVLIGLIILYQTSISMFTPPSCRFYPTCSNYAKDALKKFGLVSIYLIVRRVLRCNPFVYKVYDPLPKRYFDSWK